LEIEHGETTQRGYTLETESRRNNERLSAIALESDRAGARRTHNQERCAELLARGAAAEAELAQTGTQLIALQTERETNRTVVESAAADVAAALHESAVRQQEAAAAGDALGSLERD